MKTLPARKPMTEQDYADMERQVLSLFRDILFQPIIDLLAPKNAQVRAAKRELKNSILRNAKNSAIINGIRAGKIQYEDSTFSGDFNSSISRELRALGAKYNKRDKTFVLLHEQMPTDVLEAVVEYSNVAQKLHDQLDSVLESIQKNMDQLVSKKFPDAYVTISKMSKKFRDQYGDALGVSELSEGGKMHLAQDYEKSMTPAIKDFTNKMVAELRESVAENARTGYRFDKLVSRIQNRYEVTKSKAEFIAQQETALYSAKVSEARFGEVGITEYIWRTAGDSTVRESHRDLNGKVFNFKQKAPAKFMSCGEPCNPGEDFRCRCIAEPIIPAGVRKDAKS